jgi:uncharacterized protein (DUF1015 family)
MESVNSLLQPLVGFIADSEFAARVVGPPRATLTEEQKAAAGGDPLSFRYVAGRNAGRPGAEALAWLNDCSDHGVLVPIGPAAVIYRQEKGDFVATGLLGDLSLDAYEAGRVKRHEKTINRTQRKMTEYMRTTRIYGNPPVTAYRPDAAIEQATAVHTERRPDLAFATVDGISHTLWVVDGTAAEDLCRQFTSDLYITDGHHRLAAASLAASEEGRTNARIPAGVFSANEFDLRSFARCIFDPELDPAGAIVKLQEEFEVEEVDPDRAKPGARFEFGAKVGDRYLLLRVPTEKIPEDHYDALNTNLLTELALRPVFGIENPRLDERLRFVADLGNIRETAANADAWFLPYPLRASDVIEVADSGRTMPAKSTWFAPKLPSGLLIRPIDPS